MSLKGNGIVGIRREDKNKWERRAPLTPENVRNLVQNYGLRFLVQPSSRRIFSDQEYVDAGAEITEDLSSASLILAVKEVTPSILIPERTYLMFAHIIKAQPENLHLLDTILKKKVRLIDYECITEGGVRGGHRLVAFGRFAGLAGAVDFLRGLGERLLALGFQTPFLSVGSMYMYPDNTAAFADVKAVGERIATYGLPEALCPLTVVVTGNGKTAAGALEVLRLLPCKEVDPFELEELEAKAHGRDLTHTVYLAIATRRHMVKVAGTTDEEHLKSEFDSAHYSEHPDQYEPIFHRRILPFTSILFNCIYWDHRFPRLITTKQAQDLAATGNLKLLGVEDVSCDLAGSIEFLQQCGSIEKPFNLQDWASGSMALKEGVDGPGVLYHAVDHLPAECPLEASTHFGRCLEPFLPALAHSDGTKPHAQCDLPGEMQGAVVACHGELTPAFEHIGTMYEHQRRAMETSCRLRSASPPPRGSLEAKTEMQLKGHLFDTGFINQVLDLTEDAKVQCRILDFRVGKNRQSQTEVEVELCCGAGQPLQQCIEAIAKLGASAEVQIQIQGETLPVPLKAPRPAGRVAGVHRVLLLGSGLVAAPLVQYILKRPENEITVASMFLEEAQTLCGDNLRATAVHQLVDQEAAGLEELVEQHDVVVSLVPAVCHPRVGRACITAKKHLVTASYISPEMQALHTEAAAAGLIFLNEAGLDPGIDHMSACQMVDRLHAEGARVTSFKSWCGGLPAPQSANNPLGYKFSWSPRGALLATKNAARYRVQGKEVEVKAADLMRSAESFRLQSNPAYALEAIPNRDSIPYAAMYGVADAPTFFRGTLRYEGFCAVLATLAAIGMLDTDSCQNPTASVGSRRAVLAAKVGLPGGEEHSDDAIFTAMWKLVETPATPGEAPWAVTTCTERGTIEAALKWIGLLDSQTPFPKAASALDGLVAMLIAHTEMSYSPEEPDLVVMEHRVDACNMDGSNPRTITASLVEYGNQSHSAMSRTVGLTAAIATQLVLDAHMELPVGVQAPLKPCWYNPMLQALAKENIKMKESTTYV